MFLLLWADTAAILRARESLWPGVYEVEFNVKDDQGEACPEPQKIKVQVCTCEDGVICSKQSANGKTKGTAEFGPAGIGLLLLGFLMLLRKYYMMITLMKVHMIKHLTSLICST